MDYYDLYDITPEEEAAQDAREAEREVDEWLASWSDDFHSDEWADALAPVELHSNEAV
jgi:hypothetical protein